MTTPNLKKETMNIQLSQKEIEAAVRQYISGSISLKNKTMDVKFTATRGAQGVIADVSLEDVALVAETPKVIGQVLSAADVTTLASVVEDKQPEAAELPKSVPVDTPAEVATEPAVVAAANETVVEPAVEAAAPAVEEQAKPATTNSLFG